MASQRYLRVGLFNAGSLGTKHEEFIVAAEELAPDILALNETWLSTGREDEAPKLPGFRLSFIPRPAHMRRGRGGGVGFYIKKGINARVFQHPVTVAVIEQMWLRVRVNGKDILVGTAYRPPWMDLEAFLDALTDTVASVAKRDALILVGDFNIDLTETTKVLS